MNWMKNTIMHYMKELNTEAPINDEDLEYRVDKLIKDLERTMSARRDFKPGKENA